MKRLLKDKRNIWYLLGMLVGAAAIVVGILFLEQQYYSSSSLDSITFGADFYTEIYNASRRIYSRLGLINDVIEYVRSAFGWMFIFFGLVDICVFGSRLQFPQPEIDAVDVDDLPEL